MKLFWRDSTFEISLFNSNQNIVGVYKKGGVNKTNIGSKIFYSEWDENLNTLIIMQDVKYNQKFCTYYHNNGSFIFEDFKFDFINSDYPYLQNENKILIDYWKDKSLFKRTGTITIIDLKEHWEILVYCLLFAMELNSISTIIA